MACEAKTAFGNWKEHFLVNNFNLSVGLQDLATQIHFWDAFQTSCKKRGMTKRDIDQLRFVPPRLAEFMAGFLDGIAQ